MFVFILGVINVLFLWTVILEPSLSIIVNIKTELITECGTDSVCTPTDPCTADFTDGVIGSSWAVAIGCFAFFVVLLLTFISTCRNRRKSGSSSFLKYSLIIVAILTWIAVIALVVYASTVIKTPIGDHALFSADLKQCAVKDGGKYIKGAFYALAAASLLVLSSGSIHFYIENIFKTVEDIDEERVSITAPVSKPAPVEDQTGYVNNAKETHGFFSSLYSRA